MSGPQRPLHGSTYTGEDYVPTTTYADGTTGWSGSSTSRERAEREVKGRRQQQVYRHLLRAGVLGRTCAEVEGDLGIGHGSASSALTGLHRGRHIVRLTQRRNGQEVYVVAHHQNGREESPYRPNSTSRTREHLEQEVAALRSRTVAQADETRRLAEALEKIKVASDNLHHILASGYAVLEHAYDDIRDQQRTIDEALGVDRSVPQWQVDAAREHAREMDPRRLADGR